MMPIALQNSALVESHKRGEILQSVIISGSIMTNIDRLSTDRHSYHSYWVYHSHYLLIKIKHSNYELR